MSNAPIEYLKWYYETNVWKRLDYRGVRTLKLPLDMWNYQELIFENDLHWLQYQVDVAEGTGKRTVEQKIGG